MSLNKNWPRWIRASLAKFISTNLTDYALFFEGEERKTNLEDDWVEIRMDGPMAREISRNYYDLVIEVNCLVTCNVDRRLYTVDQMAGDVASMLDASIPVFKFGDGPDDDANGQIGCLTTIVTDRDGIAIRHFGQLDGKVKLLQAAVEVHYHINLP